MDMLNLIESIYVNLSSFMIKNNITTFSGNGITCSFSDKTVNISAQGVEISIARNSFGYEVYVYAIVSTGLGLIVAEYDNNTIESSIDVVEVLENLYGVSKGFGNIWAEQ